MNEKIVRRIVREEIVSAIPAIVRGIWSVASHAPSQGHVEDVIRKEIGLLPSGYQKQFDEAPAERPPRNLSPYLSAEDYNV